MPILSDHRIGGVCKDIKPYSGASTLEWVLSFYKLMIALEREKNKRLFETMIKRRSICMNNVDYIVSTEESDILIENDSKRITDDIVDQLIAYRKQLKLTQQDIADATGIKRANIARLELKKNEASLDSLVRYAKSMRLDIAIELVRM